MHYKQALLLFMSVLMAGGCASITRGTMDALVVESDPSGAHVEVHRADRKFTEKEVKQNTVDNKGAIVGMTPSSFRLNREGTYRVLVSKAGFETVESRVSHSVSGGGAAGMAGNVLVGGAIGLIVDSSTGAMLNLAPNPLTVILVPTDAPSKRDFDTLKKSAADVSDRKGESKEDAEAVEAGEQPVGSNEPTTVESSVER